MVRPRYTLDTNVLSEPVSLEPDAAVVEKLREHGGELATASIVWHDLAFCARLLGPSWTLPEVGRASVHLGPAEALEVFRDVQGSVADAREEAVRDGVTPIELATGRCATRGVGWMQETLSAG